MRYIVRRKCRVMKRLLKFPLIMNNEKEVRTIDELRENFNLENVTEYYLEGKLKTWLQHRNYAEELLQLERLENRNNKEIIPLELCKIFNIKQEINIDISIVEKRNRKIDILRSYLDEDEIEVNLDLVALNQEELNDIVNKRSKKDKTVYLYGETFKISDFNTNIKYIGLNFPSIILDATKNFNGKKGNIELENVNITSKNIIKANFKSLNKCELDSKSIKRNIDITNLQCTNIVVSSEWGNPIEWMEASDNTIVYGCYGGSVYTYSIEEGVTEKIASIRYVNAFCFYEGFFIYFDEWDNRNDICIYDLKLKKVKRRITIKDIKGNLMKKISPKYLLTDGKQIMLIEENSTSTRTYYYYSYESGVCIYPNKIIYKELQGYYLYSDRCYGIHRSTYIIDDKKEKEEIELHNNETYSSIREFVINDSKLFALGGGCLCSLPDNEIGVFNLNTGKLITTLKGHKKNIRFIKVLNDRIYTYAVGDDSANELVKSMELEYDFGLRSLQEVLGLKEESRGEVFIWDAKTLKNIGYFKVDCPKGWKDKTYFAISEEKIIVGYQKYDSRYCEPEFHIYE